MLQFTSLSILWFEDYNIDMLLGNLGSICPISKWMQLLVTMCGEAEAGEATASPASG
jgi:hypothetical protein